MYSGIGDSIRGHDTSCVRARCPFLCGFCCSLCYYHAAKCKGHGVSVSCKSCVVSTHTSI